MYTPKRQHNSMHYNDSERHIIGISQTQTQNQNQPRPQQPLSPSSLMNQGLSFLGLSHNSPNNHNHNHNSSSSPSSSPSSSSSSPYFLPSPNHAKARGTTSTNRYRHSHPSALEATFQNSIGLQFLSSDDDASVADLNNASTGENRYHPHPQQQQQQQQQHQEQQQQQRKPRRRKLNWRVGPLQRKRKPKIRNNNNNNNNNNRFNNNSKSNNSSNNSLCDSSSIAERTVKSIHTFHSTETEKVGNNRRVGMILPPQSYQQQQHQRFEMYTSSRQPMNFSFDGTAATSPSSSKDGSDDDNDNDDDDDDDDDDDFYNQKGNRTSKKASSSSGGKNNRMKQPNEQQQGSNQSNILAYETMEDFIGTKSSAGFSLHDDDDQVYDNSIGHLHHATTTKRKPDLSEYHNEVYEGSDSDVDDNNNGHFFHETNQNLSSTQMKNANKEKSIKHHHTQVDSFAGALSAWASDGKSSIGGFSQQHQEQKNRAVTSDGEPPLSGFELGGSNSSNIKRYPGPEVPADYVVTIHIFPNFDSISKMKKLSSQMKRQLQSENLKRNVVESHNKKQRLESHNKKQRLEPMAGPSFASLSTALKDRFTVSNHKMNATTHTSKTEITCIDPTKVSSKRTTILWQPSQLLCKRFNITAVPSRKIAGKTSLTSSKSNHTRPISETREETFFRTEVLSQLNPSTKSTLSSSNSNLNTSLSEDKTKIERPSFDLMKSIFEPTSDEDDSSNNGEDDEVDTSGHTSKDVKNRDSNISDEVAMSLLLEKGDDDKRVQKAVILLNDVNKTLGKKTDNPKRSEIDDRLSSDSSQSAFSDADSRRKKKHKKRRKKHRSKKRKDRHKDRKKR